MRLLNALAAKVARGSTVTFQWFRYGCRPGKQGAMRRYLLKQPGPYPRPWYVRVDRYGHITSWTADRRRASHISLRIAVNLAIVASHRVVIEPAP